MATKEEEYVFEPGDHEYVYEEGRTRVRVTLHAGKGVTKKQFEPAVRLFCYYRDLNAKKKKTAAATAVM